MTAELDETEEELRPPCPHCHGGPDSVLVLRRVVTYEYHLPGCPMLDEVVR